MYVNRVEKFFIEVTALDNTNENTFDISEYINSINVRKDYTNASFPLVIVNIMTTQEIRDNLRDNDINLRIKIEKYFDTNEETNEDSEGRPPIQDIIMDTVLKVYEKPYLTTNTKTEEEDENSDNPQTTLKVIPYQMIGIPEDLVMKNAAVVNEVYGDAKMDDVLVNLLSQVDHNPIFIDSSDNTDIEESLIIPPLNVIPALRYLQSVYGVYNSTMSLFFDINKTYLYKLFNQSRNYSNTLEVVTVPMDEIGSDQKFLTPMFDEDGNVQVYLKNAPEFDNFEFINYDLIGETSVFNSYDFNFDAVKRIYENTEAQNQKTRYFWNTYQNKLFEEKFLKETKQFSKGTTLNFSNIDPNHFNVDTLYVMKTNLEKMNGNYNLVQSSISYYTSDYEHYNSVVNIKLVKID